MLLGGGAFAYSSWVGTARPRTAPTSSAPPRLSALKTAPPLKSSPAAILSASSSPSAPAPASASASASAGPVVVPPEDMVVIPPGTLTMGEGPDARQVTLTRAFFIDRTEVTVRSYQACMAKRLCSAAERVAVIPEQSSGADAAALPPDDFSEMWSRRCNEPRKALDHPINCVDFPNAESYCRWRGRRLPTEAEWEMAARGSAGRAFAWGADEPTCTRACYDRNSGCRVPGETVGTCPASGHPKDRTPEGIDDLGGNVSEWVSDGFVVPLPGGVDPIGAPTAPLRVIRGGSFLEPEGRLRASWRNAAAPVTAHVTIGFRCAMDAGPP